ITPPMPPGPITDQPMGIVSANVLAPGQCQTLSKTFSAWAPSPGAWYLGAAADPNNSRPEFFDDNNTRVGSVLSVTP
ncbi:MAG TPA: hypothetical protein VF697_18855, partial [Archangium sp.]